jgi:hypothetical protein
MLTLMFIFMLHGHKSGGHGHGNSKNQSRISDIGKKLNSIFDVMSDSVLGSQLPEEGSEIKSNPMSFIGNIVMRVHLW